MFDTARNKNNFMKFCLVWVIIVGVSSMGLYIFVVIVGYFVLFVNPIVVAFTFMLRFLLFAQLGMLRQLN